MNPHGMTDGERKLLRYAKNLLSGPSDPRVSERIAKVYRNLLFRSRGHEIDEVQENIDFLEEISKKPDASPGALKEQNDGAAIAAYSLLGHDQIAALSLVHRIGENHLLPVLIEALKAFRDEPATLYVFWNNVTAKLSDDALTPAIVQWVSVAASYCRALLPTSPLAAFSIWLRTCEWNQLSPTAMAGVILTDLAFWIMKPNDQQLYRMNNALWVFVQEQDDARSLSGETGQAAKISSLLAAFEMIKSEIAKPEPDEPAIREIRDIAMPWMTEDLPSHLNWAALESAARDVLAAKPLAVLAPMAAQLEPFSRNWVERHRKEAEQSIQLSQEAAAWVDRPLYPADWTEIEAEAEIRNILWPLALPGRILDSKSLMINRVRFLTPSFYPNQVLVEVQVRLEDDAHAICSVIISDQQQTAVLDGQSPPIHSLNARGLLARMDEEGIALDYLRFFCASVWGEGSPFRIVEKIDDIPLSDSSDEATLATLRSFLKEPPCEVKRLPGGEWEVGVRVCYQNALFQSQFKVLLGGMIEMLSDQPLAAGLPVRRIVMRNGFRFYEGIWQSNSDQIETSASS